MSNPSAKPFTQDADLGIGPKRITVGAGYGMRDWLMQRITAVIMLAFTLVLIVTLFSSSAKGYAWWAGLMSDWCMQGMAMIAFVALAWHAWVGTRDIWMDYVKPTGIRLTLHVITIAWMLGSLLLAVRVLWKL